MLFMETTTTTTAATRDSNTMTNAELLAEMRAKNAAFDRLHPGLEAKEHRQELHAERCMNR
tara:strand:+ start:1819 stop:2001 length:183 start_codon:yes stop_codon:yes gene_type:complete